MVKGALEEEKTEAGKPECNLGIILTPENPYEKAYMQGRKKKSEKN